MKKFFLALFISALFSNNAFAESASDELPPTAQPNPFDLNTYIESVNFHGNIGFGYDYSFGFAKLNNESVLKDSANNLTLDDRFRNYLYIQNTNLNLKVSVLKLLNLNVSGALVSNGLSAEPLLNPDSYLEFNKFLQDRRRSIKNIWQRYGIIQDLNFTLKDENVDGSLIIGQQVVPFGYTNDNVNTASSATNPTITPMTEYINFNLRGTTQTPYQNSVMSNIRDIGIALSGNYSYFRFFTGLYNGSGTNTFDNNNEKDIFGRFDVMAPNIGEIGISHWRGKHVGYKNIYDYDPKRVDYEMYKTGLHAKLGGDSLYLLGELIFANDDWLDKTQVGQLAWYLEATFKAPSILSATARYESFTDNNALKNVTQSANYTMTRFVGSLTQSVGNNIRFREEYMHTWENVYEKSGGKAFDNYGIFSVNLNYLF